jgi:C1A family cysteine protease
MPALLINDTNADEQVRMLRSRLHGHELHGWRGCLPRRSIYGCLKGVQPASSRFPRIPRSQWRHLIKAQASSSLGALTKNVLPPHDQGRTNYCWAHGCVRGLELLRLYERQPPLLLSPESVAVPLTGGVNRGGDADEAFQQLSTYGACEQTFWPANDLNIKHAKTNWQQNAIRHAIIRWLDVENFDDQATLALHQIPVPIGLGWWGHLVCQIDLVYLDDVPELDHYLRAADQFGVSFDNSWGTGYGDNGRAYLDEKHATADLGAIAPLSATFLP